CRVRLFDPRSRARNARSHRCMQVAYARGGLMMARVGPSSPTGSAPQPTSRTAAIYRLHLLAPLGLMILGLGFVYYNLGQDRGKVAVVALNSVVACFAAYVSVSKLLPRYYAPRLFIAAFQLQCGALAAIALLGLPLGPPFHPF